MRYLLMVCFLLLPVTAKAETDKHCLALNAYHEARGESLPGILSTMFVVMNRVNDESFPNDVCDVVRQRNTNGCQFSWVCTKDQTPYDEDAWEYVNMITDAFMDEDSYIYDPTHGALFYHASSVAPYWIRESEFTETVTIDNHIFYGIYDDVEEDFTTLAGGIEDE